MYQAQIGDALHALWRQNVQDALTGSYTESGLGATPGSSGSSIQVDVDPGDVRINDSPTSVAGDTLTFDAVGVSDEFRADVIYVTASGGLAVEKGNSAPPEPTIDEDPYPMSTPQPARRLFAPSPPDGSSINGLPIQVVMIADTTSDSNDLALEDLVDYRISPPLPGDHTHPDFALNRRTEYLLNTESEEYVKLATVNDGTGVGRGEARIVGWRGNKRLNKQTRAFAVSILTGNSTYDVSAYAYGARSGATDIVVTEESASNAGTAENKYHLYAYLPAGAGTYAVLTHTDGQFGGYQYTDSLAQNDLIGSVVWDTGGSTGGPGGEFRIPSAPNRQAAVEAETDVAQFTSNNGTNGQIPVAGTGGSVVWRDRIYNSGDWVPMFAQTTRDRKYSVTSNSFEPLLSTGVSIPFGTFSNDMFDSFGLQLTAVLRTADSNDTVFARIAENTLGAEITGTRISSNDESMDRPIDSGIATYGRSDSTRLFIEMRGESGTEATIIEPSINAYARVK
jgi:hypothetical protein